MKQTNMTLMQHFTEARRRLLWVAIVFAIAFMLGLCAAPWMQDFLAAPLLSGFNGSMLQTGVTDQFMIEFSLATLFALFAAVPFLLWHIWAFIAPGLKQNEKNFIAPIFVLSPLLFITGAAFAYYVLLPIVFKFFVGLNEATPLPAVFMPAVGNYLQFVIGMLKVFGIAFQLPLVLVLLNRVGVLPRAVVAKSRRYAIVFIFIAAAVLTPPDVLSQCLLAIPMLALFEISLLFMKK